MKYRTRSTARDLGKDACDQKINVNVEKVESTTKIRMDPALKLFVRKDIDVSSMFKTEIVGERVIKFVLNNEEIEVSRSLMCLTSSLVDTLISLVPCCSSSTIVIPDFSSAAFTSLLQLLTTGATVETNLDREQVTEIKNLAKELGINLGGIATSNQYYEIIDTSENNTEECKSEKDENDSGKNADENTHSASEDVESQLLSVSPPISDNTPLSTLDENLPTLNSPSEVTDEIHDYDLFVGEAPSSFASGIQLNSTCNLEKMVTDGASSLNPEDIEMGDMGDDFEFDEEYPEEEDWDIDTEIRSEDKQSEEKQVIDESPLSSNDIVMKLATDGQVKHESNESKEEVNVKVSSLHGMIDSFLSSFKEGLVKNNSQKESDQVEVNDVEFSVKSGEDFKSAMNDDKLEVHMENILTPPEELSSVTLDGNDLLDESNQILVDGKYRCMFCESSYTQARGLFSHCSSEHFHDEIKVKFGSLITKGYCTLCNKKVSKSRVSHHLGAIHRKVNEMMTELSLPCIPCDEPKNTLTTDQDSQEAETKVKASHIEETEKEEYIPRATRSRSVRIETKTPEINKSPTSENEVVDRKDQISSEPNTQKMEEKESDPKVETKLSIQNLKLPSRLKISPVAVVTEIGVNTPEPVKVINVGVVKGSKDKKVEEAEVVVSNPGPIKVINAGQKKGSKSKKSVSFSLPDQEIDEKNPVARHLTPKKSPMLKILTPKKTDENTKSVLMVKNPHEDPGKAELSVNNVQKDQIVPITLKFGKGSTIIRKDIPPITLPPHTTIRFENNEGTKKPEVDVKTVKKLEIKSSLEKIEAKLKEFDKTLCKDDINQKVVGIENKVKDVEEVGESKEVNKETTEEEPKCKNGIDIKDSDQISGLQKETVELPKIVSGLIAESAPEDEAVGNDGIVARPSDEKVPNKEAQSLEEPMVDDKTSKAKESENPKLNPQLEQTAGTNKESSSSMKEEPKLKDPQVNYFNCPLCIYIVDKKITLREHLSIVHYKNMLLEMFTEKESKCKVCKKTYSNENHLSRHVGSNHKKLKEITSVHSKVYSVDNSKVPSLSETFPCLVCTKCKVDNCLKCIACMEMKCNPKVTEAVCFKRRCSSPITEAEFEVMRLTLGEGVGPEPKSLGIKVETDLVDIAVENNTVPEASNIKMENEQVDIPIAVVPALGSQQIDVKIEAEHMEIKTEALEVPDDVMTQETAHENVHSKDDGKNDENIMSGMKEFEQSGNLQIPVFQVYDNHENNRDIINGDKDRTPSGLKPALEDDVIPKSMLGDVADKKRKSEEEWKLKNTKRSRPIKALPKKVTKVSPKPSPVKPQVKSGASFTTNYSPKNLPVSKEPHSPDKQPVPPKATSSTLNQLRTALTLPSVIKPNQGTVKENIAKNDVDEVLKPKQVENKLDSTKSGHISPVLKCFKCFVVFDSRSVLYEHYSVKHFYSHIIKTFKPQDICPIPSCNVAISKENIWVSHVGAKHNIVEGFIPKEHRISASAENKSSGVQNSESKENPKPRSIKTKPPIKSVTSSPSPLSVTPPTKAARSADVPIGPEIPSDRSYRWYQGLSGDLLKGFEKKGDEDVGDKLIDNSTKSK